MSELHLKYRMRRLVEEQRTPMVNLSRRIHAHPELAFEEVASSGWLAEYLSCRGFDVERPFRDLPTAVFATAGAGSLRVALCAEYDALPGVGHACGHNLIAAAAAGAGAALAQLATELDVTIALFGTPGEELYSLAAVPEEIRGPGKALLLERGAFDGVHLALMGHPAPVDIAVAPTKAVARVQASYRPSDATENPPFVDPGEMRRLDEALAMAQAGVAALAKRAQPPRRVVTVSTAGYWSMHKSAAADIGLFAASLHDLDELTSDVRGCFQAAAASTGARLQIAEHLPYAEMWPDAELCASYRTNAEALGRVFPDVSALLERLGYATDMGNVSHRVPAIHPFFGIGAAVLNHDPQFAACAATDVAHDAMIDAATALAWTVIDAATQSHLRARLQHPSTGDNTVSTML